MDWTVDLLNNLELIQGQLPLPFGRKEDVLWPRSVGNEVLFTAAEYERLFSLLVAGDWTFFGTTFRWGEVH